MNIIGAEVVHDKYGSGEVIEIEGNKIKIKFSSKETIFKFPDTFAGQLKAIDFNIQEEILALLEKKKEEAEREELKKEQEKKEKEKQKEFATPIIVYPQSKTKVGERLVCNTNASFGTNSRKIYEACCKQFAWNEKLANQFAQQGRPMFAWEATPESYHVWFLCNNNWSGTKASAWENIISSDLQYIYEIWKKDLPSEYEESYRVTFAKTSDNQYVFIGVYKCIDMKVEKQENFIGVNRVFKKVSYVYPFNEE